MSRRFRIAGLLIVCAGMASLVELNVAVGQSAGVQNPPAAKPAHPFFAFCFDIPDAKKRDLEQQATLLKQLGFDGAGHVGLDALPQRVETLDRAGLRLYLAGLVVDLTKAPDVPLEQLKQALPLLKDREALVYVVLTGLPPRDPRGQEPGVQTLRALAELAAPANVRLVLYPHTNDWVAQFEHALSVVNEVDRPNCGVIFNLCHFLRNEDPAAMNRLLRAAKPRLMAVSLNGADLAGKTDTDWQRLIQPLDQGDFDVPALLRELKQLGYGGPIGLMCYGIPGDAETHLTRSMARWREIRSALD